MITENQGIDEYAAAIQSLSQRAIHSQRELLGQVADLMAQTVSRSQRIFIFGTGHSHMMAEEAFYRAGGMLAAVPIFHSALMLHEGASLSSRLERTSGFASILLEKYNPQPGEMILIYSNSGVNQLPVEMALLCKQLNLTVIGVCSRAYAAVAPLSSLGKRLDEVCDFTIDNLGQPGDALINIPDTSWKIGPSSTLIGALIWNCLLTETIFRLQAQGVELPVIISLNMPGAAEHNEALLAKWRSGNPHL